MSCASKAFPRTVVPYFEAHAHLCLGAVLPTVDVHRLPLLISVPQYYRLSSFLSQLPWRSTIVWPTKALMSCVVGGVRLDLQ